jgi:hypothetical protein
MNMNEQVLKVGNGRLVGVSNEQAQPGKSIDIYDGEVLLSHVSLDEAFPTRRYPWCDGTVDTEPGREIGIPFTRELRIETNAILDGVYDVQVYYQ